MFLVMAFFGIVGLGLQQDRQISPETGISLNQAADDAFSSLENAGIMAEKLADFELNFDQIYNIDPENLGLYQEAQKLLPENTSLKMKVTEYRANNMANCQEAYKQGFDPEALFTACFGLPLEEIEYPLPTDPQATPPENAQVSHGRKLVVMKQQISERSDEDECIPTGELELEEKGEGEIRAMLALETLDDIQTEVLVRDEGGAPLTSIACDDDTAKVTLKVRNATRDPIAVVLAMDESGSMEEMDVQQGIDETGTFSGGQCETQPSCRVSGGDAAKVGNALKFNGIDQYAGFGNPEELQVTGDMTITFWTKSGPIDEKKRNPICKSYGGEFCINHQPSSTALRYYHGGAGGNAQPHIGTEKGGYFVDDTWVHVAITRNNATRQIQFYKNGIADGIPVSWWEEVDPTASTEVLEIGNGYALPFKGTLDEVKIYDRVVSSGDIATIYNEENSGNPTSITAGLIANWGFEEASGTAVTDSAGDNDGWLWGCSGDVVGAPSECFYIEGMRVGTVTRTCPTSKSDYSSFTDKNPAFDYDITTSTDNPDFDDIMLNDYLLFIAYATLYQGVCTDPTASMRLWVERPDGVWESGTTAAYYEEVYKVDMEPGTYKVHAWSDSPVNYFVQLTQVLRTPSLTDRPGNSLLGVGQHEGYYDPGEGICYDFTEWEHISTADIAIPPVYDAIYRLYFKLAYDSYPAEGECKAPKFRIRHTGNSPEWTTGHSGTGKALSFNGTSNYVEIPDKDAPDLEVQDFTFSAWFKSASDSSETSYPTLFMRGSSRGEGNIDELSIRFVGSTENRIQVLLHYDEAGDPVGYFEESQDLFDKEWHHIAVTYNSAMLTVYIDGQPYGSPVAMSPTLDFGSSNAWIGADSDELNASLSNLWHGEMDEVRLYEQALGAGDVDNLFNGIDPTADPVGHWEFEEVSGINVPDSSGNGNDGTVNIERWWPATVADTGYCGDGSTVKDCTIIVNTAPYIGPYAKTGTYEVWGWSDEPMAGIDVEIDPAWQSWGIIQGDETKSELVDDGTCDNGPCEMTLTVEKPPETNCPTNIGSYQDFLPGLDEDSRVDVSAMNVESHLYGMRANVTYRYLETNAVCAGAAMGFLNPIDGLDDPNWVYRFPLKNEARAENIYVNRPSITSGGYNWTSAVPIPEEEDYTVLGWAETDLEYIIKWYFSRIDAAKNAAKDFVDNDGWKDSDMMGIVGFSSNARDIQGMGDILSSKTELKAGLDDLAPAGETAIADAIDAAAQELLTNEGSYNPSSYDGKFIILLTDGKANVCRGSVACYDEVAATAYAIAAANDARASGVTVYVIGFADAEEIGGYEDKLKEIAKDKLEPGLCGSGEEYCGRYYYAADEDSLQEIYDLIAKEIAVAISDVDIYVPVPEGMEYSNYGDQTCGTWDNGANPGEEFSPTENPPCFATCSGGGETCSGDESETLQYIDQEISGGAELWWAATFDAVSPCDSDNCLQETVLFPSAETTIRKDMGEAYWDDDRDNTITCEEGSSIDCHKEIEIKYADLSLAFTYGKISFGQTEVLVNLEVDNTGFKDIAISNDPENGLDLEFFQDNLDVGNQLSIELRTEAPLPNVRLEDGGLVLVRDTDYALDGKTLNIGLPNPPGSLCAPADPETDCSVAPDPWKIDLEKIVLKDCKGFDNKCLGTIIARINGKGNVRECKLHNESRMICLGEPTLRFYVIDYDVWRE